MGDTAWVIVVVGGPLLLAAIVAYGMLRNRKVTPKEHEAGESAARENYHAGQ